MFPRLRQIRLSRTALVRVVRMALPLALFAQTPPMLTLQQAEAMAVKNHPQIQAAQNEVNFANQQIVINRSAYYPDDHRRRHRIARQRSCAESAPGIYPARASSIARAKALSSSS